MDEVKFKKNLIRFILSGVLSFSGAIGFTLLAWDIFSNHDTNTGFIIGLISLIFWISLIIIGIYFGLKNNIGLTINENGISNKTQKRFHFKITWSMISKISAYQNSNIIVVEIHNLDDYKSTIKTKRELNKIKTNLKFYESAFVIESSNLEISQKELIAKLESSLLKNQI